jgi:nicotinamidase-related amidase
MLMIDNTVLLVIDVQGKLAEIVQNSTEVIHRCAKLIKTMQILQIPILHTEQNPAGLGKTTALLAQLLASSKPVEKITFSALGSEPFLQALETLNRKQILICGIETHICIYQTAMKLLKSEYEVTLMLDAISSQRSVDKETAVHRLVLAGALPSSVEMATYELLASAKHPAFKDILKITKQNS